MDKETIKASVALASAYTSAVKLESELGRKIKEGSEEEKRILFLRIPPAELWSFFVKCEKMKKCCKILAEEENNQKWADAWVEMAKVAAKTEEITINLVKKVVPAIPSLEKVVWEHGFNLLNFILLVVSIGKKEEGRKDG